MHRSEPVEKRQAYRGIVIRQVRRHLPGAEPALSATGIASSAGPVDATVADPTRRAILERLTAGDAGVVELAEASPLTQPAITKHLKVLERAGLIGRARDGQRRPARLHLEGLLPVDDWLRRAHTEWSDRLDRLEGHLAAPTESPITGENRHA
jgi:DNA-binding transcriptional ArsR family regulator